LLIVLNRIILNRRKIPSWSSNWSWGKYSRPNSTTTRRWRNTV